MLTEKELVLQFMLALASNSSYNFVKEGLDYVPHEVLHLDAKDLAAQYLADVNK